MPNEQVYKQGVVYKTADATSTWTNTDINYTADAFYKFTEKVAPKMKPHMKCRSCGNIFLIDDNLFDEEHCTFECKYNKSVSESEVK